MDSFINVTPKITVLMPVYNCELYINEAIDSILNQSYTDFEFLILDDASTDETVSIIKSYRDHRIQLIEKPFNTGYTKSLNQGLQLAKGKYIARMDGDDISLPERFAKQVAYLEANPDVVLCGTCYKIIGNNRIVNVPEKHDSIKLALLRSNCFAHSSVMIRRKTLEKFSINYDFTKEPAEDYDMWVRLLSKGRMFNIQEVLLEYRVHKSQVSQERIKGQQYKALETRLQVLNYLDFKMLPYESEILKRIVISDGIVDFHEIEIFQNFQIKLIKSNIVGFFEPLGFQKYLSDLESQMVKKYFLKRNYYSPLIYLNYLGVKNKLNSKFTIDIELKLLIKCLIFWRI